MAAERRAEAVWQGNLFEGHGTVTLGTGIISNQPVTWAARTEQPDGKTSPEELIAGAHATCYAMALSNTLAQHGHPPEQLDVTAVCTFDPPKITTMVLTVRGRVPGLDDATFKQIAQEGEQNCPVSNALRNNVDIRVTAELE